MNPDQYNINRREALKYVTSVLGGTFIGAELFLSGCTSNNNRPEFLSQEDVQFLDEVGETILPESNRSPGAKAAHIGSFMKTMVMDCYSEEEQKIFKSGIEEIRRTAFEKYGKEFMKVSSRDRFDLLLEFDRIVKQGNNEMPHFFEMMRQLTVLGYFTSEVGVTQAMRYDPVPGSYNGCAEYKKGDKAWYGPLSSIG
jgi:Gluconate 2-dehydrogenase subunit 3